jgi:hypothetical protein
MVEAGKVDDDAGRPENGDEDGQRDGGSITRHQFTMKQQSENSKRNDGQDQLQGLHLPQLVQVRAKNFLSN